MTQSWKLQRLDRKLKMHTSELRAMGVEYVPNFIGVFPLDRIPATAKMTSSNFIINTHTHNLPGEHWLAVSISNGVGFAFDSFGFYYPESLRSYLRKRCGKVHYNTHQYQEIHEKTCGLYCIAWLIYINASNSAIHWLWSISAQQWAFPCERAVYSQRKCTTEAAVLPLQGQAAMVITERTAEAYLLLSRASSTPLGMEWGKRAVLC